VSTPSGRAAQAAVLLGADYQHLHAWSEAVHALRPGSCATALAVEAVGAAHYDDVVVERSDGGSVVQAKFAVNPTGGFSVDWLLEPVGQAGASLARRALTAHKALSAGGGRAELRLVTNRTLADGDAWLSAFRGPDGTLGHAVGRLLDGSTSHAAAAAAIARLREHLNCDEGQLLALLRDWELRWSCDLGNENRLAKARMVALGLRDGDDDVRAGRDLMRRLVQDGVRKLTVPELRNAVDGLRLRLRQPAVVLSISLIDKEPAAGDADVRLDLRDVFAGRAGDVARGLGPREWAERVAEPINAAVVELETAGSRRVLVRAAARLPVWFYLGSRMRQVRDWTVLAELGGEVYSSDDPLAAAPQLAPQLVDDDDDGCGRAGGDLHVAVSVTADIGSAVVAHVRRAGLSGPVLRLMATRPGPNAVGGTAEAARLVDDVHAEIAAAVRSGGHRRVHLYLSTPRIVPLMLGHRWNGLGTAIVYEDLIGGGYQAAFEVA